MAWPTPGDPDTYTGGRDNHDLDVYFADGKLLDVRLDGESMLPTWFKIEFKENGEISAKVKSVKLSTRLGDTITIHTQPPPG